MNLVLDLGNTKAKVAVFDKGQLIFHDSYEILSKDIIENIHRSFPELRSCIVSSVINESKELISFLENTFKLVYFDADTPIPITNKYKTPHTLGKDRLAAAIGAAAKFPKQNVLSIDAGTALKFDFVNANSEYLGGSIAPGIWLRFKALHNETDKLPLVGYQEIEYLIGSNTQESILSGVIQGISAEVDGLIDRYKERYPGIHIIVTGGEAVFFEKKLKNDIFADSNLVLNGLNLILEHVKQHNA
jgi:type III pantothenate kinase